MNPRLGALVRLLAFVAFVFVVLPLKGPWLRAAFHGGDSTVLYIIDHLVELVAVLVFAVIIAALERRPFGAYGLPGRQAMRGRFWQGAALGLVSLSALVVVLCGLGAIRLGGPSTSPAQAAGFGAVYLVLFVLLATREEFLYRGYGQFTLSQIAGFGVAALATTTWFTWTHSGNGGENWLGLANVAAFGLLACLMLRRTGNLWLPIGFHAVWDWGQTWLFGVGDSGHPPPPGHLFTATVSPTAPAWLSGGSVGPEGSALCFVVVAGLAIWIARWRSPR